MKKRKIKFSEYRILLSLVLPYELPVIVSQIGFYQLAEKWGIHFVNGKLQVKDRYKDNSWACAFVNLLNGNDSNKSSFNYYIKKERNSGNKRELVLIHPFMQLKMMEFYKKYGDLIINFCSKSHFSIRRPIRRAVYIKPRNHNPTLVDKYSHDEPNEIPKNYFIYGKYRNINSFYESSEFLRMNSRFEKLFKCDIEHCFDNINLSNFSSILYQSKAENMGTCFGSLLSNLMKSMNQGRKQENKTDDETDYLPNSVLIGPEFSRLVAEMFLQQIDVEIEKKLEKNGVVIHRDYECMRYVDDLFFFCKDDFAKEIFYAILKAELGIHGMKLNTEKSILFEEPPFINEITIAKREIKNVVTSIFNEQLNEQKCSFSLKEEGHLFFNLHMDEKNAIAEVNSILIKYNVELSKVSAYLLSLISIYMKQSLDTVNGIIEEYASAHSAEMLDRKGEELWHEYENRMAIFFRSMVKLVFYIFNNDQRMNTSIRVLLITNQMIENLKGVRSLDERKEESYSQLSADFYRKIYKVINDELCFILRNRGVSVSKCKEIELEVCNIMLIQRNMPDEYAIHNSLWTDYMGDAFKIDESPFEKNKPVHFLSALTLLGVMKHRTQYSNTRTQICKWLISRLEKKAWSVNDTECFQIMINMMTSPYVDKDFKNIILENVDNPYKEDLQEISEHNSPFFFWSNFNVGKACKMKYSAEVY